MTSTTQLNTSSLSRDFKNDTVNNSSQLNAARNTPQSFRPSGVTRESRADDSANPVQAPACVLPLLRPTKGTDVYISMRADGTHDSTASGLFFSPSFLAASDQVSFDESLSDWIPGGEGRAGWIDFDIPVDQLPPQLVKAYQDKDVEVELPWGESPAGEYSGGGPLCVMHDSESQARKKGQ